LDQDGNYTNVGTNEVGALNISNFLVDVARSKYQNYKLGNKFGRNPDIDTGSDPEDVWFGGGEYTGFNATSNENLQCFSSSTSDVGLLVSSGTATGGTTLTLVDSGATFVSDGVASGDLVINNTQSFHGIVVQATETTITVDRFNNGAVEDFAFSSGDSYRVASSSGTGAAVVKWQGILNEDYEEQGDAYMILNGTSLVNITIDAMRCSRGKIILSGSGGVNAGNITLRQQTTTANVFALLQAGAGQTAAGCDTVPKNKTRIITNFYIAMARANGSAGSANAQFQTRRHFESWQTKRFITITSSISYIPSINPNLIITEKSDVRWRIESVSDNNTTVSAEFEYLEIANDSF
jgi:hypothetical protein